jgi:linoleoyl-CoA desaturase
LTTISPATARDTASATPNGQHGPPVPLKFIGRSTFQGELKRRIDEYFTQTGRRKRDCWQMYLKSAILLTSFFALYAALVFAAPAWWLSIPVAIALGLVTASIGMNIQHDGSHQAYSDRPWINRLTAMTLEMIGGSSYLWHYQHGVFHHTYTNITGHDNDVDVGIFGRLTPHQKRLPFHRWQHLYMWFLYGFVAIRWHIWGDISDIIRGKMGDHPIPRPKGWNLVQFIAGKLVFLTIAFAIPMIFHPWWVVLLFYALIASVIGIVLTVVFQLAHAVEGAEFTIPDGDSNKIDNAWAIHQAESTVDFARGNRIASYVLGGLNYQIEHHLFPRICHINYPAMSKIVEQTCHDFGVKYNEHRTFSAGVRSHYRWLRYLGRAE